MGRLHETRLEIERGRVLRSFRPTCVCGWAGETYWSRSLAERVGSSHQRHMIEAPLTGPVVAANSAGQAEVARPL